MPLDKKLPLSAMSLAGMIIDSKLLPAANVRSLLAAFEATATGSSATAFAEFLASRAILTRWQAAKLCSGKWKGFFVGHYRLEDHLSSDETGSRYAATDLRWQRRVVLAFSPGPPPPKYVVEEPGSDN